MLGATVKALAQMASPPFRAVLLKSVGLALLFLVLVGIGLQRLFAAALHSGAAWLEATLPAAPSWVVDSLQVVLSLLASGGVILGVVFLVPAVTALVASFFADEIAAQVESHHYPADPPGRALPLGRALLEGSKTALLAVLVYLCAVPFLFLAGLGAIAFFFATAYLLGREYFHLAAMRFHPPETARALRRREAAPVFLAGMLIAAFVSVPILNLATPLFATALMVHIHKRLTESRRELIEPSR